MQALRRSTTDLIEGMHRQHSVAADPAHQLGQLTHGPACRAEKVTAADCRAQIASQPCAAHCSIPLLLQLFDRLLIDSGDLSFEL